MIKIEHSVGSCHDGPVSEAPSHSTVPLSSSLTPPSRTRRSSSPSPQMKTALVLAFGALAASAAPELVFSSSLRGGDHCSVVMNEAGVLVSSCDLTHGATGFASLQGEVDALKAENAALRSSHESHATEIGSLNSAIASLRTELIAKMDAKKAGPLTCRSSTTCSGYRYDVHNAKFCTQWKTSTSCE